MKTSYIAYSVFALALSLGALGVSADPLPAPTVSLESQLVSSSAADEALACEPLCTQEEELCVQSCLEAPEDQREACENHCGEVYAECLATCES